MDILVAFAVLVLLLVWVLIAMLMSVSVSRPRLERFARREALPITPANGNLVIRYLAVTRRWRTIGLLLAIVGSAAWSTRAQDGQQVTVNFLAAFAGWFVGAAFAELRVAGAEPAGPRAASLEPRLLRDRLRRPARWLPIVELAGIAALTGYLLVRELAGPTEVETTRALAFLALGVATLAVPAAAGRYVLQRPQPLSMPPDVRAADDARRDRSLHVLAGSAIALLGYPLAQLLGLLDTEPGMAIGAGVGLAMLVLALCTGWLVATASRSGRQLREIGRPDEVVSQP